MNKLFAPLCLLLALSGGATLSAQSYFEAGIMGGDMPYNGDISDPGIGFLKDWNTFGGFYLRYRPIQRVGLRFNGVFGNIAASQETTARISAEERVPVTREFRSKIQEFSLAAEVDLFYLGDPDDRFVAPYIMVGVGRTAFNPQAQRDGLYVDLQPLGTEGQGIGTGNYAPAPYALNISTIHAGGGIRAKLGERLVIGGEVSGRFTGTDYLDDVSNVRVRYGDILVNGGEQAAFFSNRAAEPGETSEDLTYVRGGGSDDFYFLINLTLGIRLGGWGGGGSGCYQF